MWQAKEKARSERQRGMETGRQPLRKERRARLRVQDIRIIYRRLALQQAKQQKLVIPLIDIDNTAVKTLLDECTTAPINASKRLTRLNTTR